MKQLEPADLSMRRIRGLTSAWEAEKGAFIWQADDRPRWRYDLEGLAGPLAEVSRAQGMLLGRLADVGVALRDQATPATLTENVVKTIEIEGEVLSAASVGSSIARRGPELGCELL